MPPPPRGPSPRPSAGRRLLVHHHWQGLLPVRQPGRWSTLQYQDGMTPHRDACLQILMVVETASWPSSVRWPAQTPDPAWRRVTALLFRELTLRGFVPALCAMARHCLAVAARRAASRASHSASAVPSAIAGAHTSHSRAHVAVLGSRLPWQGASPFPSDNLWAAEFGLADSETGNIQGGDMHFGRGRGTSILVLELNLRFQGEGDISRLLRIGNQAIFSFLSTLRFRGTRIQPSLFTLVDISFALTCL